MNFWLLSLLAFLLVNGVVAKRRRSSEIYFDQNYYVTWGGDHFLSLNRGSEVQLSMDKSSGSGFGSKQLSYTSGFFRLEMKLPGKDSAGVVTAFYLTSNTQKNHDELDFEFLGDRKGKPYTLQTNVFSNGLGNREQRIHLWFDPTADFHSYGILWNRQQIVFFVDNIPIRVFKNYTNIGVSYPTKPMQIQASLWDGDSWATGGGKEKINWSYAPFKAHFQGFGIDGCASPDCYSTNYWWNGEKYWKLDSTEQREYENVKKNYMIYDYCSDRKRYPSPPPECH